MQITHEEAKITYPDYANQIHVRDWTDETIDFTLGDTDDSLWCYRITEPLREGYSEEYGEYSTSFMSMDKLERINYIKENINKAERVWA